MCTPFVQVRRRVCQEASKVRTRVCVSNTTVDQQTVEADKPVEEVVRDPIVDQQTVEADKPVEEVVRDPIVEHPGPRARPARRMSTSSDDNSSVDGDDVQDPTDCDDDSSGSADVDEDTLVLPDEEKCGFAKAKPRGRATAQRKAILDAREQIEDAFAAMESYWTGGCTVWDRQKRAICEAPAVYRSIIYM